MMWVVSFLVSLLLILLCKLFSWPMVDVFSLLAFVLAFKLQLKDIIYSRILKRLSKILGFDVYLLALDEQHKEEINGNE